MSYFYSAFRSWCWSTPVIPLARNSPVDASTLRATPCMIAMTQIQLSMAIGNLKKVSKRKLKQKKENSPTVISELHTVFKKRSYHGSISGAIALSELMSVEETPEEEVEPTPVEEKPEVESVEENSEEEVEPTPVEETSEVESVEENSEEEVEPTPVEETPEVESVEEKPEEEVEPTPIEEISALEAEPVLISVSA